MADSTRLSELEDWQLVAGDQDLRGRELRDEDDKLVGQITDLFVDTRRSRVDSVEIDEGKTFPVERLAIRDDAVYLRNPPTGIVRRYRQ